MWFDVQAALAEIEGAEKPHPAIHTPATIATTATKSVLPPRLSQLSRLSQHPPAQKPEITPGALDSETYLALLHASGPKTYGAAAVALGWGATRAWQAEARLRAAGLVRHGEYGLAYPLKGAERGKP